MIKILFKKSTTPKHIPSPTQLDLGELAINAADATLFFKGSDNTIVSVGNAPVGTINNIDLSLGENILLPTPADINAKATVGHTHSVDTITTTDDLFFAYQDQKQSIINNSQTVDTHSTRVNVIEQSINSGLGLVKFNADSKPYVLADTVDGQSLALEQDKITVKTLAGLTIDPQTLNLLSGVTGNVQEQINLLSKLFNFTLAKSTLAELRDVPVDIIDQNDTAIVIADEEHNNRPTMYVYVDSAWQYAGAFRGADQRDFTVEPIDLATETTGTVSTDLIENQSAKNTPIADVRNNFTTKNVEAALEQLSLAVDQGRKDISTLFGAPFTEDDTLESMQQKLSIIRSKFIHNLLAKDARLLSKNTFNDFANNINSIKQTLIANVFNSDPVTLNAQELVSINVGQAGQDINTICLSVLKLDAGEQDVNHYSHAFTAPGFYSGVNVAYGINGARSNNQEIVTFTDTSPAGEYLRVAAAITSIPNSITV